VWANLSLPWHERSLIFKFVRLARQLVRHRRKINKSVLQCLASAWYVSKSPFLKPQKLESWMGAIFDWVLDKPRDPLPPFPEDMLKPGPFGKQERAFYGFQDSED
jgi:hypothetical protein